MSVLKVLLFPFSVIYDLITGFRNHLYNINYKRSFEFEANVICVGNLAVGGTGKSPMIIYLIKHLLAKNKKIATLSRGYGRKTKGFLIAGQPDTGQPDTGQPDMSQLIGDEPAMFYRQFKEKIVVSVCEDRAFAIPQILYEQPDNDVILMDDGFQHRAVNPSLSIILTTWDNPFYRDLVLPAGRLRESRKNLKRADIVVHTKCPNSLSEEDKATVKKKIWLYNPDIPVFFTGLKYGKPYPLIENSNELKNDKIIAFSGIANDGNFQNQLRNEYDLIDYYSFSDHHSYKKSDILPILDSAKKHDAFIITTEKDAVKIEQLDDLDKDLFYVLPVKVDFLDDEEQFLDLINGSLKEYDRNQIND